MTNRPASPSRIFRIEGTRFNQPARLIVEALDRNAAIQFASRHLILVRDCVLVEAPAECTAARQAAIAWANSKREG